MSVDRAKVCFARVKFADFLGATIVEVSEGRAVLALPFRPELLNAGGILSGGASASLLNMAGTVAAWTTIESAAEPDAGCVDMSLRYLDAAAGEDIVAEAHTLRRGRGIAFLEVALRNRSGKPICQGLMVYRTSGGAGHPLRLRAEHRLLPAPDPMTPPEDPWLFRGYMRNLGITPLHQTLGTVRLHMPCPASHTDEQGRLHAGALASLVDIAGVSATWSLVPSRQGARGSTIGMHVAYTSAATEPVVADAHVQQRSEELFFATVHVTTAATGQLVAIGEVSYRLLEPR